MTPAPPRVLLVRAGALGDVLLLRRAIAALKAGGESVVLVAPARAGAAVLGPGGSEADAVFDWDDAALLPLLRGEPLLPAPLRGCGRALVWSRSPELRTALGAAVPAVLALDPTPPPGGVHASRWLAAPLLAWGLAADAEPPPLAFTAAEQADAASLLDTLPARFLAVHPGSGAPAKNWSPERFFALVARLRPERWLLVEGPADEESAAPLRRLPGVVRASSLPTRTLAAVLSRCGACVGNDSGVSHLAAATGAPTVTLFGPTDPALWAPVGRSVTTLRAADRTMNGIAVDEVAEAAARALAERRP